MEPIICIFSKKMMIIIFCFYYGKNKTKNDIIVFFLELYIDPASENIWLLSFQVDFISKKRNQYWNVHLDYTQIAYIFMSIIFVILKYTAENGD